jgi:hypothetical protein
MFALRRARARRRARGQTLVELALILPALLLIVLVAIDFGRVFFGYVVLTNASRIGANYAASHPGAWGSPGNPAQEAEYADLILRDTDVANCALVGGTPPDPTFTDGSDTATPDTNKDVGDRVDVGLSCTFRPLTPIVSAVVGSSVVLSANTEFAVRAGTVSGVPVPPPPTPGPTPTPTPTPVPGASPTPTPTPTPTPVPTPTPIGNCAVPDFVGNATKKNSAPTIWANAGFSGAITHNPNPNGNWTITSQSISGSQPCTSSITIGG